jgi:hypothetical protein
MHDQMHVRMSDGIEYLQEQFDASFDLQRENQRHRLLPVHLSSAGLAGYSGLLACSSNMVAPRMSGGIQSPLQDVADSHWPFDR